MPRFMPVQCHQCSVLQIKPAQKRGLEWCCSMCRPSTETKGSSETQVVISDVSLFVEELNVPLEEAEEMGAVANTFRGVECLDGASIWEGLYYQSSKVQKQQQQEALAGRRSRIPIQVHADSEENGSSNREGEIGQKRGGQFLSALWGRWHQKAVKKDVVELMEFAGGLRNQEIVPPRS